jgi:peptide-methionine (S)-S-oxide reductase
MADNIQLATLGNGCFWCTEAVFQQVEGVLKVTSGYSGGDMGNPDYETVCTGVTGHAECLQIEFDADTISFRDLLEIFFETHDPTTLNRQGNDIGSQYRSVIFYHSEEQKEQSYEYIQELENRKVFKGPIVTTIELFSMFFPAESYHHDYYRLNSRASYCQVVISPKLKKFKKLFAEKLKA